MSDKGSRVAQVAGSLRASIYTKEYEAGARLPTETQLAEDFGVSRPTVRAALGELKAQSLVRTVHGVGTFVEESELIRTGLERLDSITESIRSFGHEPGMTYHSRAIRRLIPEEAGKLDLFPDSEALEIRRSILSDGQIVAYSYDLIPIGIFPDGEDPNVLTGSIFEYLRKERGLIPDHAVAEIHAVSSDRIAWDPEAQDSLYILLDQVHYTEDDRALMYSRTYFLEGRYSFLVYRRNG